MDPRGIFRKEDKGMARENRRRELICWGIHVPPRLKGRYKALAAALGVPLQDLTTVALEYFLVEHEAVLLHDDKVRHRFGDLLRRRKLEGH